MELCGLLSVSRNADINRVSFTFRHVTSNATQRARISYLVSLFYFVKLTNLCVYIAKSFSDQTPNCPVLWKVSLGVGWEQCFAFLLFLLSSPKCTLPSLQRLQAHRASSCPLLSMSAPSWDFGNPVLPWRLSGGDTAGTYFV